MSSLGHSGGRWNPLIRWLAIIGITTSSVLLGASTPAYADGVDLLCTAGTTQITYSPGLHLLPQVVNVEETDLFTGCVSSDPNLHSGIATFSGPLRLSCAEILGSVAVHDYTVFWDNGQSSTFTFTFTITTAGGYFIGTFNGVVTAGQFAGDTARMVFTYLQPNTAQCLTPTGVTEASGTITAEISSV